MPTPILPTIRGKLPDEKIDLGEFLPWDTEGAESIVHGLMRCFDIEEDDRQYKSAIGEAIAAERVIRIPAKIDTPKKFLVAVHEIGHIKYSSKKYTFDYLSEYDAEQYAINIGKSLGFIKKRSMDAYIISARKYVLSFIMRDIKKIKIKDIPTNIVEWIDDADLNKKFYGA